MDSSDENAHRVFQALAAYGAPVAGYTPADFQDAKFGFQFGTPPSRVDVLLAIDALSFDEAWKNSVTGITGDGIPVHYLSVHDLIKNKLSVGRLRDLADVEALREAEASTENGNLAR